VQLASHTYNNDKEEDGSGDTQIDVENITEQHILTTRSTHLTPTTTAKHTSTSMPFTTIVMLKKKDAK
jgi:hypothetical protein